MAHNALHDVRTISKILEPLERFPDWRMARSVLDRGSPLPLWESRRPVKSGSGLPHSKTWRRFSSASQNSGTVLIKLCQRN